MIELSVIRDLVAILGVLAGLSYYIFTVRNQKRSRQAQLFMQMYDKLANEMYVPHLKLRYHWKWDDFSEFWEVIDPLKNPEDNQDFVKVIFYWESLGVLVKRGFIDASLVDDLMSGTTLDVWERLKPVVMEWRERFHYPQFQEFHELLAVKIKEIVDEQHPDFQGLRVFERVDQ